MTSELKRNITSFTGIVGSEKINDLCKIKMKGNGTIIEKDMRNFPD